MYLKPETGKPESKYEIDIKIGADNLEGIENSLSEIKMCIIMNREQNTLCNPHVSISGGVNSSWSFVLMENKK